MPTTTITPEPSLIVNGTGFRRFAETTLEPGTYSFVARVWPARGAGFFIRIVNSDSGAVIQVNNRNGITSGFISFDLSDLTLAARTPVAFEMGGAVGAPPALVAWETLVITSDVEVVVTPPPPEPPTITTSPFTLGRLVEDAMTYTSRADVAGDVRGMVDAVEMRIRRDVRALNQEIRAVWTVPATGIYPLPGNFLSFRSLTIGDRVMQRLTPEQIRESSSWNESGQPCVFSTEAGSVLFMPLPGGTFTVDVVYFANWGALVSDSDTNWLLQNNYDLYLYALCAEIGRFTQDMPMMTTYEAKYMETLEGVRRSEREARYSGSAFLAPNLTAV